MAGLLAFNTSQADVELPTNDNSPLLGALRVGKERSKYLDVA